MKTLAIAILTAGLVLGLTACEPEEETTKETTKETTTKVEAKADPSSCQEALELDDMILGVTSEVLQDIFNTEQTELATETITAITPKRNELQLECLGEAVSEKQNASELQTCIDVLNIDDVIFAKTGEAFQNIFDTAKMDDLTTHVRSVTDERLEKKALCEDL